MWRSDKTKEKEFELLGKVTSRKVNTCKKLMVDNSFFGKVVVQTQVNAISRD